MKILTVLKSRKLWAAIIAIGLVIAQQYGKTFDGDQVTGMIVILASYIVGAALDPGKGENKFLETLASKKFWVAVVGLIVIGANTFGLQLPISGDAMLEVSGVIGTLIVAMGYADKQQVILWEQIIEGETESLGE
jgi:uncharacterized membrane protein